MRHLNHRTAVLRALVLLIALGVLGACDSGGSNSSDSGNDNSDSEFNVDIRFLDNFDSGQEDDIEEAVNLWKTAITSDLETVGVADNQPKECTYDDQTVEDIVVVVSKTGIDGSGGTLAKGGTCAVRDNNTTALGSIELDKEDLPLDNPVRTVAHEVGHVLGIGTSWDTMSDSGSDGPLYKGTHAENAYKDLGGEKEGVPLADNERHWREDDLGTELMTPEFKSDQSSAPLSTVSLAALKDIGYSVDLSEAESYSMP